MLKTALILVAITSISSMSFAVKDLSKCRSDVVKFCSNVASGAGRIGTCLNSHKEKVTPACKASLAGKTAPSPVVKEPVVADPSAEEVMKNSTTVIVEAPKAISKEQTRTTSEPLKHAAVPPKWDGLYAACESEINSFCWGVKKGDIPANVACLKKNSEHLGDECTGAIK